MMQPSSAPQSAARNIPLHSPPRWVLLACALTSAWLPAVAGTSGGHRMPLTAQRADAAPGADARSDMQASKAQWRGETYASLTERWWRWYVSIPYGVGPSVDPSGANCGINQSGPVWFLAGKLGSTWASACTVPVGKAILTPVFDVLDDYPCPDAKFQPAPGQSLEAFLQADIANYVDPLVDQMAGGRVLRPPASIHDLQPRRAGRSRRDEAHEAREQLQLQRNLACGRELERQFGDGSEIGGRDVSRGASPCEFGANLRNQGLPSQALKRASRPASPAVWMMGV